MSTTTEKKFTKAMKYAEIRAILTNEDTLPHSIPMDDLLTFIDKEAESLTKKNSKENAKREAERTLDKERAEAIVEYMLGLPDGDGVNPTQLNRGVPVLYDLSTAKVTYLLRLLKDEGRVMAKTVKGKTVYTLC